MIALSPSRPLRCAVLVKQVPGFEEMDLGPEGRLNRATAKLEMDSYGRRAAALAVLIRESSGGEVVAFTMGPESARDVLRECLAGGVDRGVHICDQEFAGSDSIATARVLARALELEGPFDLVLAGRASVDSDTGQVPPQIAQMMGLPFASGCKEFEIGGELLSLGLEHDDRWVRASVSVPAVVTCAERLCDPLKLKERSLWASVDDAAISNLDASTIGHRVGGQDFSPSWIADVRRVAPVRKPRVLDASNEHDLSDAVARALAALEKAGAFSAAEQVEMESVPLSTRWPTRELSDADSAVGWQQPIGVVVEAGREELAAELLGRAAQLAVARSSSVEALAPEGSSFNSELSRLGADRVRQWPSRSTPSQLAAGVVGWVVEVRPWALLLGATDFGREVGARVAAEVGAGMTGDAVGLELAPDGSLATLKAAAGGTAEVVIQCRSALHVATVRPGVLPVLTPRHAATPAMGHPLEVGLSDGLVIEDVSESDHGDLLRSRRVVGIGNGVGSADIAHARRLADVLGAELGATRKVTDSGLLPRARQIGVTGHSIAPDLYVALGVSGRVAHMAGVTRARVVLAVDIDPHSAVFSNCDVGIVGDWIAVAAEIERQIGG